MKEKLKNISSNMIKRYSDRYNKLGYDVKTLGWGNKLHKDNIDCHFDVYNVLDDSGIINNCVDIAYLIGVLNLNFKNEIDNYEYSFKIIKKAFNLVTESLVVNLLDDNLTPNYPKEDFVFYHNAKKMQEFGITIAKKVDIKYSPNPIPQKEFNLILYK
jgi:hypothetical protein